MTGVLAAVQVTDTASDMLGFAQDLMSPILHFHESLASFDPFPYV